MTISQLADLIIIGLFFGALGSAVGDALGRFIVWIGDKIMTRREARGKETENGDEVEQ